MSTTGGRQFKSPRREDFTSVLEYLEAKYVKSFMIEVDAAGGGSVQAAAKSQKNKVKMSESSDPTEDKSIMEVYRLEKKKKGQKVKKVKKSKEPPQISSAGESVGASFRLEKKKVKGANATKAKKLPVPSSKVKLPSAKSATSPNPPVPAAAIAAAASKKTDDSMAKQSSVSEPTTAITLIDATDVEHLPKPPQQQNQNTTATTNGPMSQQNHQGHAPWPQCPPPGYYPMMPFPFPQPPFGMYPPPFGFGMYPPFVPQAQLLQPMQGQYNVTQPPPGYVSRPPQAQAHAPDAGKDELEKETKSEVTGKCDDRAKSTSDTSSTELLQLPLPALPPIDVAALGEAPLVAPPLPALPQVKDTSSLSDAQLFQEHLPPSSSKKRALESSQSPRSDPLPSSSSKKMTLDSSQILRML